MKQPPRYPNPRSLIDIPAVIAPHAGTSYNPPVDAHTELVLAAGAECEKELQDSEKYGGVKEKAEEARVSRAVEAENEDGKETFMGMKVDVPGADAVEDDDEVTKGSAVPVKKLPSRKTKQQRKKALLQKAEVCQFYSLFHRFDLFCHQKRALLERKHRKVLLASLTPSVITSTVRTLRQKHEHAVMLRTQREHERAKRLKEKGLAGKKIGRHRVAESRVEVQTGEELSENLRGLKVCLYTSIIQKFRNY